MITLQERVHAAPKPDDWQLDKLHQVFRVRRGHKNAGMKEDNLLSLSYGRIIQKDIQTADGLLPENFEGYQIVEPGNIVLRLTDLQNDKRSLRQGLVTQRGIITSAYDAVEVQRDNDPRFWFYSLLALDLAKHYYSLGGGVRQSVKFADFPNDWVYRPYLATQRQIADFLDRETARIDLLIEKKQRLVALLGEKAASEVDLLIDGTHPRYANAPTEYAERTNYKLKILCSRLGNGFVGPTRDILVEEDETDAIPYLQSTHVKNRKIDFQRKPYFVTRDWLNTKPKAQVRQDDLVIVQTGDCGATAIVDEEFHGSGCHAMIITRPKPDCILPRYLLQVLCSRSGREMLAAIQTGALHPHLEVGFVKDVSIPTPLRSVQDEILRWIENELDSLERIQEKTQTSIDRLKEYRSALITAAVTGQIDVQTYAKSGTPDRRLDAIQEEMGA
ncbi:restriction endonuclease subunit S [Roseovarius mucosus]|uniref:restriction endonuclease subunit S n=1 Tax=Roseovarius mucosus TaxID=215743 RepID=UPI003BA8644A